MVRYIRADRETATDITAAALGCFRGLAHSITRDLLAFRNVWESGGPGSIPGTTRKKSSGSGTGSTQPREYN
jgi:hypothetical protein